MGENSLEVGQGIRVVRQCYSEIRQLAVTRYQGLHLRWRSFLMCETICEVNLSCCYIDVFLSHPGYWEKLWSSQPATLLTSSILHSSEETPKNICETQSFITLCHLQTGARLGPLQQLLEFVCWQLDWSSLALSRFYPGCLDQLNMSEAANNTGPTRSFEAGSEYKSNSHQETSLSLPNRPPSACPAPIGRSAI